MNELKGYCRAEINTPKISCITEVKTMKKTWHCYKCRGLHIQYNCTDKSSNTFHAKTSTCQHHKGNKCTDKFQNKKINNIFPMGTLSFHESQPVRSGKDMLVSIDTIKCFLEKTRREVQL